MKVTRLISLFLFAVLLLSACGMGGNSPEEQVHHFIKIAREAAENRDTGAIKDLISDTYSDERERTKTDLVRVTAGYFLRHKSVHLFTHIGSLTFPGEESAELQLFVAMAGRPITAADMLLDIRADLYRFDMLLTREGKEWRLSSSAWRPATIEDFFPEESE